MSTTALFPLAANASVFSVLGTHAAQADTVDGDTVSAISSSDTTLSAVSTIGPGTLSGTVAGGTDAPAVITDAALTPSMGPVGNASDAADVEDADGGISFYTIRNGDTITSVAKIFNISESTLRSANSLKKGQKLKTGDSLVILPVSDAAVYTIKAGDTITKLAKTKGIPESDLYFYNDLTPGSVLSVGDTIIIPDQNLDLASDAPAKTTTKPVKSAKPAKTTTTAPVKTVSNDPNAAPITVHPAHLYAKTDVGHELLRPVDASISHVSQYAHGFDGDAADIAAPAGSPIRASLDGTVLLARDVGYNDGYGDYVIIMGNIDGNPVETIDAHMSKVLVTAGMHVSRGEEIGEVGRTGDATGNHVHFEARGVLNPWTLPANRNANE